MAKDIYSYDLAELEELLTKLGLPKFRAKQLHEWLHTHHATSYDQMTNLPKALRQQLSEAFPLSRTTVTERAESADGTRKYLLKLEDGLFVESVGIPSQNVSRETFCDAQDAVGLAPSDVAAFDSAPIPACEDGAHETQQAAYKQLGQLDPSGRLTVCFSTQVGCGMNCAFCATGTEGFSRNLTSQEMVDQVNAVQKDFGQRVSNVVAMGQGEPFLNYDNLLGALRRFNTDDGFLIGARHITVSTCGIIDGIRRFTQEPEQFTLAISLHSGLQEKRDQLMPALRTQPLFELRVAIEDYIEQKGRRVTFEYLMIDGVNDGEEDLEALIGFCSGLLCHVNLIPLNQTDQRFASSPKKTIDEWAGRLERAHISTTVRHSKGGDIAGACGQLKNVSRETFSALE